LAILLRFVVKAVADCHPNILSSSYSVALTFCRKQPKILKGLKLSVIGAAAVIVVILVTAIHFTSGDNNEVNMVEGNDVANFKESSGIHFLEVDAFDNNGWSV
jgi:hypothetical protein